MTPSDGRSVRRTRLTPAARPAPGAAGPGQTPPAAGEPPRPLAGQIGAEVALALSSALDRLETLLHEGRVERPDLQALASEIRRARQVAMLGQQVGRLAAGLVRQSPETLELPQVLREVVGARRAAVAGRGLTLRQLLQPATVSADPALLFTLLSSLLDWACEHVREPTLVLSTGMQAWPVQAVLECRFAWRPADRDALPEAGDAAALLPPADDPARLDSVAWRLVQQAAGAMGVQVERADTAWQVNLRLLFPETVRRWPRLVDAPEDDAAAALRLRPLAGARLLVHAERHDVRLLVQEAVAPLGLQVDHVATLGELQACARAVPPDVLLVDARGPEADRVLAALKAGGSGPALVHVDDAFRGLEIISTGRVEILRVGRDSALRDLPAALGHALTR